jgi:hypothetical protein
MGDRTVHLDDVEDLRSHRWRTASSRRLRNGRDAERFVVELGFVLLMPMQGAELASMRAASQRDWVWWDWKQTLPARKACYYAKLVRNRGTFVSWKLFPAFYSACADPRPYSRQHRDGLLGSEEKRVLDLLAEHGPMMTREIRLAFGPRSKVNTRRVKTILVELQRRFLITASGGDTSGWSHHEWDLVERWVPAERLVTASRLPRDKARAELVAQFIRNQIATTEADIAWVLGWNKSTVSSLVHSLVKAGHVQRGFIPELDVPALTPKPYPRHPTPARVGRGRS